MVQKKSKMSILISNNILGFFLVFHEKKLKNLTKCHKKQSHILHIVKRKMNQYSIFSISNSITSHYIHINKATNL